MPPSVPIRKDKKDTPVSTDIHCITCSYPVPKWPVILLGRYDGPKLSFHTVCADFSIPYDDTIRDKHGRQSEKVLIGLMNASQRLLMYCVLLIVSNCFACVGASF